MVGQKLRHSLRNRGYHCETVNALQELSKRAASPKLDLILLAFECFDRHPTANIQTIRRIADTPIIVFNGPDNDYEEIACLEAGCDDYLSTEASTPVRVTRVRSSLRRYLRNTAPARTQKIGNLQVSDERLDAYCNGEYLGLTPTEYKLLQSLISRIGKPVSRTELIRQVWGDAFYGDPRIVDSHIANLRKKLYSSGVNINLGTARGVGYFLSVVGLHPNPSLQRTPDYEDLMQGQHV